jgi:archaellum component FlaF (FlaF/FlaG flagellin family)
MSKDKPVLYFEKRYQLLLHSLSVGQRVSISTLGAHTAHKELFERTLTYSLNQVVDVSCIDLIQNGTTISDNQVPKVLPSPWFRFRPTTTEKGGRSRSVLPVST